MIYKIGRRKGNQLVLKDQAAEEFHAAIEIHDDLTVTVKDNNTRFGTLVNGNPIQNHVLTNGDELQIGFSKIDWKQAVEEMMLSLPEEIKAMERELVPTSSALSTIEIPEVHLSSAKILKQKKYEYPEALVYDLAMVAFDMLNQPETELEDEIAIAPTVLPKEPALPTLIEEESLPQLDLTTAAEQHQIEIAIEVPPMVIKARKMGISDTVLYLILYAVVTGMVLIGWFLAALLS